jgi:serine O-acetyltransferase
LIDNAATQEHQLIKVIHALNTAGIQCDTLPELEKFDPQHVNKLVE